MGAVCGVCMVLWYGMVCVVVLVVALCSCCVWRGVLLLRWCGVLCVGSVCVAACVSVCVFRFVLSCCGVLCCCFVCDCVGVVCCCCVVCWCGLCCSVLLYGIRLCLVCASLCGLV